jgi:hypothetical protein
MSEIKQLKADAKGKYLITTQGSQHLWDMDQEPWTWVRMQKDGLNPMYFDERTQYIRIIEAMPAVGGTFRIWWSETPDGMVTWHISSIIVKIEKVEESTDD